MDAQQITPAGTPIEPSTQLDRRRDPKTNAKAREAARLANIKRSAEADALIRPLVLEMRTRGETLDAIAARVNRLGFRTAWGNLYTRPTLIRVLDRLGIARTRPRSRYAAVVANA